MKLWVAIPLLGVAAYGVWFWQFRDAQKEALGSLFAQGYSFSIQDYFRALSKGDLAAVKTMVASGASVDVTMPDGKVPLQCALQFGHVELSKWLVAQGAAERGKPRDLSWLAVATCSGKGELMDLFLPKASAAEVDESLPIAAKVGSVEALERLLPRQPSGLGPALVLAAEEGHLAACDLLLRSGAEVDSRDPQGRTPLMATAKAGWLTITKFLLLNGADRTLRSPAGETAVVIARAASHPEVEKALQDPVR